MAKNKVVNCPHCKNPVEWIAVSHWRPFCSERCKMIDLGAWASEEYSVASEAPSVMDDFNSKN